MSVPIEALDIALEGADNRRLANFAGPMEQNLRHVEERLGVEVRRRGHQLQVLGPPEPLANAEVVLEAHVRTVGDGDAVARPRAPRACRNSVFRSRRPRAPNGATPGDVPTKSSCTRSAAVSAAAGPTSACTWSRSSASDLTFGIGPAGTGKTYLAVASAVEALHSGSVRRIVLVRPAVEAGERLGFLPGDLAQKVDPYLRPMYDALYEMMGFDKVARNIERQIIEVAPLAFMRGRSLNDSFIILDEAQNTSVEQMKMFLTRLGFGSKAVVTGDITQVDLPRQQRSGLRHAIEVLRGVEGVAFTFFNARDVVRHPLVQRIVQAYERNTDAEDARGPRDGTSPPSAPRLPAPLQVELQFATRRPWAPGPITAATLGTGGPRPRAPRRPTPRRRTPEGGARGGPLPRQATRSASAWSARPRVTASTCSFAARTSRPTCCRFRPRPRSGPNRARWATS